MKIKGIEHIDIFDKDEIVMHLDLKEIPEELIKKAKEIDRKNYSDDGFGICVLISKNDITITTEDNRTVYYIDHNGDKNYLDYKLSDDFLSELEPRITIEKY